MVLSPWLSANLHCSSKQKAQLFPRRRFRVPRPIRGRPRRTTREVQTIPYKMHRGDHLFADTAAEPASPATQSSPTCQWWLHEPRRAVYGRHLHATAPPETTITITDLAKHFDAHTTTSEHTCDIRTSEHRFSAPDTSCIRNESRTFWSTRPAATS